VSHERPSRHPANFSQLCLASATISKIVYPACPSCLAPTTKACWANGQTFLWAAAQPPKDPLDLPVFATSGQSVIITKFPVGLPGIGTIGQARPDREGLEQFELAQGLAYLWLQQVRSSKKLVTESVWPEMSNSGQAAGQGSQALIFSSSWGKPGSRERPAAGEDQA